MEGRPELELLLEKLPEILEHFGLPGGEKALKEWEGLGFKFRMLCSQLEAWEIAFLRFCDDFVLFVGPS